MSITSTPSGPDNLTKNHTGTTFPLPIPNQPIQDSRVAYGGPVKSTEKSNPTNEDTEEHPPVVEDVVKPDETEEEVRSDLAGRGFTPGEINLSVEILNEPTGDMLARKITKVSQRVLDVVVQELDNLEISKAMDIISYGPDIRGIVRAIPPDRLEDIANGIKSQRIHDMVIDIANKNEEVIKDRRFKIIIDNGDPKYIMAKNIRLALKSVNPDGSKVISIEEVS
jgi:hypothetical protein